MKKIIFIAVAAIGLGFLVNDYFHQKSERARESQNHKSTLIEKENALKLKDSLLKDKDLEIVEYKFKKDDELKAYLEASNNQLNGLQQQLRNNNIRLKEVSKLVSTVYTYRDTSRTIFNYDSLAQKISNNQSFEVPFIKKSPCITTEGRHVFKNGKFNFEITNQEIKDTITSVVSWKRKKHRWVFGIKTGLFGKPIYDTKTFSKCIDPNTIIINIKNKKR